MSRSRNRTLFQYRKGTSHGAFRAGWRWQRRLRSSRSSVWSESGPTGLGGSATLGNARAVHQLAGAQPAPFSSEAVAMDNVAPRQNLKSEDFNTSAYGHIEENPFLAAVSNAALHFLDRRRHRLVFQHPALYRKRFAPAEGRSPGGGDDQTISPTTTRSLTTTRPSRSTSMVPPVPGNRPVGWSGSVLQGKEMPNEKRPASNLVFLLDVSGSMGPANRLPLIKGAMRLLVEKLGETIAWRSWFTLALAGLALPSTPGDRKEQILTALENLQAGGSTNGAQGIELAYRDGGGTFHQGRREPSHSRDRRRLQRRRDERGRSQSG